MKKIIKFVSLMILVAFTMGCLAPQSPVFAASTTGTLKIFSETKGIKVYIDEELKGTDVIEVRNLEPGAHYVKIVKDDTILYSELVTVGAGATSAVLLKTKAESKEQALDTLYKEQQQYKQEKLDIMLSKTYQTVGSSYSDSMYFPGYYFATGSEWTTSKSTAYEITDWKIIKGGVQQISDSEFANLVGDKATLASMNKDWEDYNNLMNWGAGIALVGVIMVLAGGAVAFGENSAAAEGGAVLFAVGCLPAIVGLGMLSKNPPSGHYVNPGTAAKQAFEYNQSLKKKLGLPESYEAK